MTKVAVVFAEGFEEIEALSPVDVFRRAGFDCSMLGLESASVTGSHGIQVAMDGVFDGNFADYDLVVVDGNIVTSRGAGTALAFAYALVDLLGGDGQQLAHTMVYDRLFQ